MKPMATIQTLLGLTCAAACVAQTPLGSAFTFQGQLQASGLPVIAAADFQFALFDAATVGSQVGATVAKSNVGISNGAFTVSLDFGTAAFQGDARWLEVSVRSPAGAGGFSTLAPRQLLTVTPNATFALQTRGISVDATGQVGIGTETPEKKLTVAGDMSLSASPGQYRQLQLGGAGSDGFLYSGLVFGEFPGQGGDDGIHLGYNFFVNAAGVNHIVDSQRPTSRVSLHDGGISLATHSPGLAPVNHLVITEDGFVGIGTNSPDRTLDVDGDSRFLGDTHISRLDTTLRVMGGRQSISDEEHLIWKMGDYLTIVPDPDGDSQATFTIPN
ncbi:MAG: hypothetical protein IPK83_24310 [Planctomycetes bacterium]|nr:hypothetical protein [Planctomycetota bacterium]